MPRTRIKICGITRRDDAMAAINAGADAIGLVFYAGSKRAVDIGVAQGVLRGLPPLVTRVGLFVDAEPEQVAETCAALPLDLLQFHGDESPEYCESFGLPYMKALRVAADTEVTGLMAPWGGACAVLLDTWRDGSPGGTGECFDWSRVPAERPLPLVLAGGLRASNVGLAIDAVAPYAVDVSGGVESSPGVKDAAMIAEFVTAVAAADVRSE